MGSLSTQSICRYVRILCGTILVLAVSADAFGQRGRMSGYPPTVGNLPIAKPSRPGISLPSQAGFGWRRRADQGAPGAVPYIVPYPVYIGSGDAGPAPPASDVSGAEISAEDAPDVLSDGTSLQEPPPAAFDTGPPAINSSGCENPIGPSPTEYTNIFFVALNDGSVHTAIAYWVEGSTLHYMTPEYIHNQVSLALVDQKTSAALNGSQSLPLASP